MKPYTKIYLNAFGYDISSFIPCEVCNEKSSDIFHIGDADFDSIENVQARCEHCHETYGHKKIYRDMLFTMHQKAMNLRMRKRDV
jgi:hypothetical protein